MRSLGGLFAVAENYPTLKSDANFLKLQRQLAETEDRIAAGRRCYNGNVRAINTRIEAFPSSIVAGIHHLTPEDYVETHDPAVRAPANADLGWLGSTGDHARRSAPTGASRARLDGCVPDRYP